MKVTINPPVPPVVQPPQMVKVEMTLRQAYNLRDRLQRLRGTAHFLGETTNLYGCLEETIRLAGFPDAD